MKHKLLGIHMIMLKIIDSGAVEGKGHIGFILDRPGFKNMKSGP